jgi:hypothetical protein
MKKLKFGQTPFDRMTKKELREVAIRMFSALESTNSCLRMSKWNNESSSYWGKQGSGGIALEKAKQVLDPIYKDYGEEKIYRMFYRYSCNLIFDEVDKHDWQICDKDGTMFSPGRVPCPACGGKLRDLTLEDLKEVDELKKR